MRLIDADANIEIMKKCAENPENAQALLCYRYAQRILEEAPTVEPANAAFLSSRRKWYAANNTMYDAWTWMPNVPHWMTLSELPKEDADV